MQFLEPISSEPARSQPALVGDRCDLVSIGTSSKLGHGDRRRLDWLSDTEANLLLSRMVRLEAKKKNYSAAIQLLTQLIAYEPNEAEHYTNRGLMHYHARQWAQALADYNQAIYLNPELDKAYSNRANLHAAKKNWQAAIADYDQAVDLSPLNIRARLNQAITFREMSDYEEALVCLDIAIFFKPESATLYAERGRTYHLQGDWNCAAADYTRALEFALLPRQNDLNDPTQITRRVIQWMNSFS